MKRVIAILLAVLNLANFASCNNTKEANADDKFTFDKGTIELGNTGSNMEGMKIKIVNAEWDEDNFALEVNWMNGTDYDVVYGDSYDIQRFDNGEWSSCVSIENLAFNLIGYELAPGAAQKKVYGLSKAFDVSLSGRYRIKTDCSVYENGRDAKSTKCELWAEFTVSRSDDTASVDFFAQYIRTDGYHSDAEYPIVKIIRSVEELNAYYENNKDKYDLERKDKVYSDTTIGFLDACNKYDQSYFEKQILIIVLLEEESGSNRHRVDYVGIGNDGKCYINISTIVRDGKGTSDLAEWHILIEPEEGITIDNESQIYANCGIPPTETEDSEITEGFEFSLTWNVNGISSYDSSTGKLVKTSDATHPEDYVTTYYLTDDQKKQIYSFIDKLDIKSYPDEYDPYYGELGSDPSMTLILTVRTDDFVKTVSANNIAITYDAKDEKGQAFLDVCREIQDIVTATDEWKLLPECEISYY